MANLIQNFFEGLIRNIEGNPGRILRKAWYRRRLGKCGVNLDIAAGVRIINPKYIEIGDNCAIDYNAILMAGPLNTQHQIRYLGYDEHPETEFGFIRIGKNSHIGINNIIQGHGGVTIGDYFTTSAGCTIYSFSNDYRKCRKGTMDFEGSGDAFYIAKPVRIGANVWLGLQVNVISATIGTDVFVKPGAVVTADLGDNVVAEGFPAQKKDQRFSS